MKMKNTDDGPRGFYADGVMIVLEAGATSEDVTPTEAELAAAKKTEWFEIQGRQSVKADDK